MSRFYTDLELELMRAKLVAQTLDAISAPRSTRDVDAICISCGRQCHYVTHDPHAPALVRVRCNDCAAGDPPPDRHDTAWSM